MKLREIAKRKKNSSEKKKKRIRKRDGLKAIREKDAGLYEANRQVKLIQPANLWHHHRHGSFVSNYSSKSPFNCCAPVALSLFLSLSTETNDCYIKYAYYLRRLKKSGTSKHSYHRFPFRGFFGHYCCYYHYHHYNPLRVADFHINLWALAD